MTRKLLTRQFLLPLLTILILTASSCSVVFTGSVTGSIVDSDKKESGDASPGIAEAEVFLYTEEESRDDDLAAWTAGTITTPDVPAEGKPGYFIKTDTDEQGAYTFNGLIWNELFPEYGKSGDRKEIYMLFLHRRYGLVKNPTPVYIVSDVTNRIPQIELERIYNTASVNGKVINKSTGGFEPGVQVDIYTALEWRYNTSDPEDITVTEWSADADYTVVTDNNGEFESDIEYKMKPTVEGNLGTSRIRLVYTKDSFRINSTTDPVNLKDDWDRSGDGTADTSYLEILVKSEQGNSAGTVSVKQTEFSETLSGQVVETGTTTGVNGVEVWLFFSPVWDAGTGRMETAAPTDGTTYTKATTTSYQLVGENTIQNGVFRFDNLQWTDTDYTQDQSRASCWVYLPTAVEITADTYDTGQAPDPVKYYLKSDGNNFIGLEQ